MSRYTKGGITIEQLLAMPFEEYLSLSSSITDLILAEQAEMEKATSKWKK